MKTTKEIIEEIKNKAENRSAGIRYGQEIFNITNLLYPLYADFLTATLYDCYYQDLKVDLFLKMLEKLIDSGIEDV